MPVSLPPLLPIDRLALVGMEAAPAGSLMIHSAEGGGAPYLAVRDSKETDQRSYALALFKQGHDGFRIINALSNSGYWLKIDRWQLLVDPSTAYMGTGDFPEAGDAFVSGGTSGFVARWSHATAYIGTNGLLLDEPNFGSGYVGYRKWAIVIDVDVPGKPHVLIEWTRAA